ncbi:TVP38/TMEM64 family protein [Aerococcaceae bacterium DSM 111176]|nr:TVP38/TMEM64 family protein [Aerococcaceae bacterium DSM 111176]
MDQISVETKRRFIRIVTITGIILTIIGSWFIGQSDYFQPNGGFNQLLVNMGIFSPIVFIAIQVTQIIIPLIPFGLIFSIGGILYGTFWGFIINFIGVLIGSAINFYLGRRFGANIVLAFLSDEQYVKYMRIMNKGDSFKKLLIIGFIAPLFPDDVFCMIAGMSKLTFWEFYKIVILFRPISLFIFTYASSNIIQWVFQLIFG